MPFLWRSPVHGERTRRVFLMLLPLFLLVALAIRLESPGPVFFRQVRVGCLGQTFSMWKFRSMFIDAEERKEALEARNEMQGGVLFKGDKGTIMCGVYGNSPRIIPEAKMQAAERPERTIPRVQGSHEQDWIRACKSGEPAGAAVGQGAGSKPTSTKKGSSIRLMGPSSQPVRSARHAFYGHPGRSSTRVQGRF